MTLDGPAQPNDQHDGRRAVTKGHGAVVQADKNFAVAIRHVALLHDSETTPTLQRFIVGGATLGTIGFGLVWPPLAPLFLAGVAFGYAAFIHSQTIVCTGCFAHLSPAQYPGHECPPLRRRKRLT